MNRPDATGEVELEGPYDLAATMSRTSIWGSDPTRRVRRHESWVAFRTKQGPATVRYVQHGDGVRVSAWGPGAAVAIERAPAHLGAEDRSFGLEVDHPIVGPLLTAVRGLRFGRSGRVMERLSAIILAQKVTSEGASRSWRELVWRHGERAPGPEKLWLPPTGEELRKLAYYDLHPVGVERRRADTLLFAARRSRRIESSPPSRRAKRTSACSPSPASAPGRPRTSSPPRTATRTPSRSAITTSRTTWSSPSPAAPAATTTRCWRCSSPFARIEAASWPRSSAPAPAPPASAPSSPSATSAACERSGTQLRSHYRVHSGSRRPARSCAGSPTTTSIRWASSVVEPTPSSSPRAAAGASKASPPSPRAKRTSACSRSPASARGRPRTSSPPRGATRTASRTATTTSRSASSPP